MFTTFKRELTEGSQEKGDTSANLSSGDANKTIRDIPGSSHVNSARTFRPKVVKMDFPKYDSEEDPTSWVLKKELGGELITWQKLVDELFKAYGPTRYQDFFGELTKLKQTSMVKEYQIQFSRLLLRVGKLSPEQQVGCFVRSIGKSRIQGKFEVVVANGEKLSSPGQCKGVFMRMQKVTLMVDFYVLPLEGCDAVLEPNG
ncbi:hypothetical protein Patl1_03214 [Pistacia atlantica]|uniref:Uncharacterized protein n=1 Tax=Pistacia atlantica TaxID=434234 RepID=A0ACC1C984_9ROSI|nr:hypothetical protein Patl1_03214 [Pistacia atlantica]